MLSACLVAQCSNMKQIILTPDKVAWCVKHATAIVEHHKKRPGCYNHNNVDSNIIGVKGEVALVQYLKSIDSTLDIAENFIEFSNHKLKGDVFVAPTTKIEVKTVRPYHWDNYGRMIPPDQLEKYVKKEAVVVWATASPDNEGEVTLQGWNHAREVKEQGIFKKTRCDNIWLVDPTRMKPMYTIFMHF